MDIVLSIHNDMDLIQINSVVREFRTGAARFLIITGLIAGDIGLYRTGALIINYDLPTSKDDYFQRAESAMVSLITLKELQFLAEIEAYFDTKIYEISNLI